MGDGIVKLSEKREPHRALAMRLALIALATPFALHAQKAKASSTDTAVAFDSSAFAALTWREIGPFRGGRSVTVAGSPSRHNEYYMGTTGGGVFKTTDGGETWLPVTDKYFGGTIGAVAVSESNPDIVYVGAGEYDIRGDVSHGDGAFKSTDAGKTWHAAGLTSSRQISRIRIDPHNPDIAYAAVLGHVWVADTARGIYKTTDGGAHWRRILFRNDSTGAADLVIDPSNPGVLYAALWQAGRTPWLLVSGGAGSGIFKSTDAGEHWTEITRAPGLPGGIIGNIGLSVSPVAPRRVWAIVEADSGGVFRSDDGGATWTRTNDDRKLRQRAWYFSRIFADTKDSNRVYVLNVHAFRSDDAGKSFDTTIVTPSTDNHDLWIAPDDPQRMIEANDGGATVSINGGRSWLPEAQPTGQFYHVETTTDFPYRVCGAQQDAGTLCGPSRLNGGIDIGAWYTVGGGESGYIAVRPDSPSVVFAGSYGGRLTSLDTRTQQTRLVSPWPDNPMGYSAGDIKYRFQWTYPIVLSPHDPNTLYAGAQVLFRSRDDGMSWKVISPDLTRHDPRTLGPSGGPITKDQTSVEYYGTIFTIAVSPLAKDEIWTGSDDGEVHLTRDGGATWSNVSPGGMPEWMRISIIEPSHFDPATAYVAGNRYQLDDNRPFLYKTTDYGKHWTAINTGIPAGEFTRVIREDPERRGLLYAGTERSVWVSFDDGAHWQSLRRKLPLVPIHDLAVKNGDLIAATHGRGFWILDDISPLRQLAPSVVRRESYLFAPRPVYRATFSGGPTNGARHDAGPPKAGNPPNGALVYYWLGSAHLPVTLDFLDARGKVIRSYTSLPDTAKDSTSVEDEGAELPKRREAHAPNKAGLNRFAWDLRYPHPVDFNEMVLWAGLPSGARVVPGSYAVRLTVNGHAQTQTFVLRADPRSNATQLDLVKQFALLEHIGDTISAANNAVRIIRNVKTQLQMRDTLLTGDQARDYRALASSLADSLSRVEESIYQVRTHASEDPLNYPIQINDKLAELQAYVDIGNTRPTLQDYEVYHELTSRLAAQLSDLRVELKKLDAVNALLRGAGLTVIVPSTEELTKSREPSPISDEDDDDDDHR
ncbi:MAG TPA: glycosyl hydrolase [Gemmatimonadaceae bacterium]|nr:glycosyl hydrolase [Gemmatimonadaceae bacterium]